MIYIKVFFLFIKVLFNINKYKYFLEKPDGLGKKWTLYKRPIFQKKRNMKKAQIPETKAHHFIYHAFESLETKSPEDFKKEMFDNIILGIMWYNTVQIEEKQEEKDEQNHNEVEQETNRET
jgi:hypothetical protein